MWMQKLSDGVLRVLTPLGPRYIRPTLLQRLYILWIFRHFHVLPLQVLSRRQRALIESLARSSASSLSPTDEFEYAPILGTVERRPPVEVENLPPTEIERGCCQNRTSSGRRCRTPLVRQSADFVRRDFSLDSIAAHVGGCPHPPTFESTQIFPSAKTHGSAGCPEPKP
jgi:hypothetical protein